MLHHHDHKKHNLGVVLAERHRTLLVSEHHWINSLNGKGTIHLDLLIHLPFHPSYLLSQLAPRHSAFRNNLLASLFFAPEPALPSIPPIHPSAGLEIESCPPHGRCPSNEHDRYDFIVTSHLLHLPVEIRLSICRFLFADEFALGRKLHPARPANVYRSQVIFTCRQCLLGAQ